MTGSTDKLADSWVYDVSTFLDTSKESAETFVRLLKDLVCHHVLEQLNYNPDDMSFRINLAPVCQATLTKDDHGNWILTDIDFYSNFIGTLEQTISSRRSKLYEDQNRAAMRSLNNKLDQFSASRKEW